MSPFDKVYQKYVLPARCPSVQLIWDNRLVTAELAGEIIEENGDGYDHLAVLKIPNYPLVVTYPVENVLFIMPCTHEWEKKYFANDTIYQCKKCGIVETDRI